MIKILNQECYEYWKDSLENYEDTKHLAVFQITPQRSEDIRESLLAYRRAHNIFEVGDCVVSVDFDCHADNVLSVMFVNIGFLVLNNGEKYENSLIRHATDAEIVAGMRLPQLEVLRDCDIPLNTIILGDE